MEVTWRDAGPEDAPLLGEIGRRSFVETFGHLYTPENLAAFLENHNEANWRGELSRSAIMRCGSASWTGSPPLMSSSGRPRLPFTPPGPSIELRQFYVLKPWQGAGLAPR